MQNLCSPFPGNIKTEIGSVTVLMGLFICLGKCRWRRSFRSFWVDQQVERQDEVEAVDLSEEEPSLCALWSGSEIKRQFGPSTLHFVVIWKLEENISIQLFVGLCGLKAESPCPAAGRRPAAPTAWPESAEQTRQPKG